MPTPHIRPWSGQRGDVKDIFPPVPVPLLASAVSAVLDHVMVSPGSGINFTELRGKCGEIASNSLPAAGGVGCGSSN